MTGSIFIFWVACCNPNGRTVCDTLFVCHIDMRDKYAHPTLTLNVTP
nr:MAG TPA: hypothetical protein [Caudoviricetes sp.]DAJ53594.1 MAG TPA: hypothetical protein [Caudoviricetes sp.]